MNTGQAARSRTWGVVMLTCVAYVVVTFATFHLLRRDVDPLTTSMSQYANGRYGSFVTLAFVAIALAAALAAWSLWRIGPQRGRRWIAPSLLGVMGLGFLLVAIFPQDPGNDITTTSGGIHNLGGVLSLAFGAAGIIVASVRFRRDPRWSGIANASLVLGILLPVSLVALILSPSSVEGLVDRAGPPTITSIWFLVLGARLVADPSLGMI